jgi:hypothetical protein
VHTNKDAYVPKLLAKMEGRPPRFGAKAIADAYQRLIVNHRIRIGEGKDDYRKRIDRIVYVEGHVP